MDIIKVPNQVLRQKAEPVTELDQKVLRFVDQLESTLKRSTTPSGARGVGLSGNQVDKLWRVFSTNLDQMVTYINPRITKHSPDQVLGEDPEDPDLEGCLSIPLIWGPIPRWPWVELEYEVIKDDKLVSKKQRFENFYARLIQHELDHLNGVLFTDYSLKYDLPVYQVDPKTRNYEPVEKSFLELL